MEFRRSGRFRASVVALLCMLAVASHAQPAFEAASVRPSAVPLGGGHWSLPSQGQVVFAGIQLRTIIGLAHGIELSFHRVKFVGGDEALLSSRFDIRAKIPENTKQNDPRAMLRSLLQERFGLRTHTELRQIPLYVLTVARQGRLGPGLRPSKHNCGEYVANGGTRWSDDAPKDGNREICWPDTSKPLYGAPVHRFAGTINDLIVRVAKPVLPMPVVDQTGLEGNFEWEVAFVPDAQMSKEAPTLFTAFEDQLGLKLESRQGPYEVIVIDDVRVPTPN